MITLMASTTTQKNHSRLSETVYAHIKQDIFDFGLRPGDRLPETELAEKLNVSRTPVRQALSRLEQEGYLKLAFRNGWTVSPLDFERFEQLYDLRIILELAAVQHCCEATSMPDLDALSDTWLVPKDKRLTDARTVSKNDEDFHAGLVIATKNDEMVRVYGDITEKIRIIRRLDFIKPKRIQATYDEHAEILNLLLQRQAPSAAAVLRAHIQASKAEVRKITLHMIQTGCAA